MYRKLAFIGALVCGLILLLILQPWKKPIEPTRFHDRLPVSEVIGSIQLLEFAQEIQSLLYQHDVPFREFTSPEFILRQGKAYGIDVQSTAYFFGNENKQQLSSWGILLQVSDSSKLNEGIENIADIIGLRDTTILDAKVHMSPDNAFGICYGTNWLLITSKHNADQHIFQIASAKRNSISPRWRTFLNSEIYKGQAIRTHSRIDAFEPYGVSEIWTALTNDSSSLTLTNEIIHTDSLPFQLNQRGPALEEEEYTKYLLNLHLALDSTKDQSTSSLYKLLSKASEKIHFPIDTFFSSWNGDFCFRQGGIQTITQRYITTEIDDNFNYVDVERSKQIKISSVSAYLSTKREHQQLIPELKKRGILTKEENKVHLLFSPPMNLNEKDTSLFFHSGTFAPSLMNQTGNSGIWTINYTPVRFDIDSTNHHSIFGRVHIPMKKIIDDYIPTK